MVFSIPSLASGAGFAALGVVAGLLSAFFGIGGGWIVTPVLLLTGLGAPDAVGTSMAYLAGTGIVGVVRHARHGAVDFRLGVALGAALTVGVELGRRLLLFMDALGRGEAAVQWILLAWLAALGASALYGTRRGGGTATPAGALARQWRIDWKPRISVRSAEARVSIWTIAAVGFLAGVMGGLLGLGGGVILIPAMVGLMGVEHRAAVATSLVGVSAAGLWGAARYAFGGHVDGPVAAWLIAGALLGVPVGVRACRAADARGFRRLFGTMMLLASLSVGFGRAGWRSASLAGMLLSAVGLAAVILWTAWFRRPRRTPPCA